MIKRISFFLLFISLTLNIDSIQVEGGTSGFGLDSSFLSNICTFEAGPLILYDIGNFGGIPARIDFWITADSVTEKGSVTLRPGESYRGGHNYTLQIPPVSWQVFATANIYESQKRLGILFNIFWRAYEVSDY